MRLQSRGVNKCARCTLEESARSLLLNELAYAFTVSARRGEQPSVPELAAQYPDLATEILDLFPTLVELERVHSGSHTTPSRDQQSDRELPSRLGEFRILSQIGSGGMGDVYEAIQEPLGRRVALKVLAGHGVNDPRLLERFKREAQAASSLHHTNIVPVYGIGQSNGMHYYAMQFIAGQSLDRLLSRRDHPAKEPHAAQTTVARDTAGSLSVLEKTSEPAEWNSQRTQVDGARASLNEQGKEFYRTVARIGEQAADALAYAHANGVLHRDIKPANLILDDLGNIWISDFGLARIDGLDELTLAEDILGTLRYIPPERFKGCCDARGDVYSLGLTLYELLVDRPAFQAATRGELIHHILSVQPPSLRSLDKRVPRELETIVHMAIAKEPHQRYQSAAALAEDLQNFQTDRPILARRQSIIERTWRLCRRNRINTMLGTAASLLLVAVAIISTKSYLRENELNKTLQTALSRAQVSEVNGRRELFASYISTAKAERLTHRKGQRIKSLEAIENAVELLPQLELLAEEQQQRLAELRDLAVESLSLPDIRVLGDTLPGVVLDTCFFNRCAQRDSSGTLIVRNWPEDIEIARLPNVDKDTHFQFSPQPTVMLLVNQTTGQLWRWHIGDAQAESVVQLPSQEGKLLDLSFSRNAQRILLSYQSNTKCTAQVLEWPSARLCLVRSIPLADDHAQLSPDGRLLAAIDGRFGEPDSHLVRVIEVDSGEEFARLEHTASVCSAAWHPDSQTLSVGLTTSNDIVTWDVASGKQIHVRTSQRGGGPRLCVNSTGELLTSFSSWANMLDVWDAASEGPLLHLAGELNVAWSHPDGRLVGETHRADGGWHFEVVEPSSILKTLKRKPVLGAVEAWRDISIHRDGRLLAVGSDSGVSLFDLETGLDVGHLPVGYALHPCFVPQTGELLTYSQHGLLRWPVISPEDGEGQWTVGPPQHLPGEAAVGSQVASDRSGRTIAIAAFKSAYIIHDSGERVIELAGLSDCRNIAVSPDGRWVVTGNHWRGSVDVWSGETGQRVKRLREDEELVTPRFSNDDSMLAINSGQHSVLFETQTWQEIKFAASSIEHVGAFSPDSQLFVELHSTGVNLLEASTGRKLFSLNLPSSPRIGHAAFSPDGEQIVLNSNEQHATYVWDISQLHRALSDIGLDWTPSNIEPAVETEPRMQSGEPLRVQIVHSLPANNEQ